MTEKKTLKEIAFDEYMRLWYKGFGLSGNGGDCRATAAYIAKKFGLSEEYVKHAASTAIEDYTDGLRHYSLTSYQRGRIRENIALVEQLLKKENPGEICIPDRFFIYIEDSTVIDNLRRRR